MADMFDCGLHQFRRWSRNEPHAVRFYGPFDPSRTAREQWAATGLERCLHAAAFGPFERGWNTAAIEHAANRV